MAQAPRKPAAPKPAAKKTAARQARQHHQSSEAEQQLEALSRAYMVVEFALDGTVLMANELFLSAMGYDVEEVVGQHHSMFVRLEDRDSEEYQRFWERLRSGQATTGEFTRVTKAGEAVRLHGTYIAVRDERNRPAKIVKYAIDITGEVRRAERLLLDEREQMSRRHQRTFSALHNATRPVLTVDENFNIVYFNRSMREFLETHEQAIKAQLPRFSLPDIIGTNIDVFHREPEVIHERLRRMSKPTRARLHIGGRALDQWMVTATTEDGEVVGYSIEWSDETAALQTQSEVEGVLKAAVTGDLTRRLDTEHYEGFTKFVGDGMNQLLDLVSASLYEVQTAVTQIGEASSQLRTTSQMMSTSAVDLDRSAEASSTMLGQATSMVRRTAENAAVAAQLVSQTATTAETSQTHMQDMMQAMSMINGSAQKIAKIIDVIDEIAFQTNLLALNAAVEAARAGRHGKGFAVVAQEVRSLAERSARAAKDTAELIEDSVHKASDGVAIATGTRGALEGMLKNVSSVVGLVAEIATASDEQAATLEQLNQSMGKVAESSQSGSQQSTEVASAAEEMGRQMELLREQVAGYTVNSPKQLELPEGVSPELVQAIAKYILGNGAQLPANLNRQHIQQAGAAARGAAPADPKAIFPLDGDERGYGRF